MTTQTLGNQDFFRRVSTDVGSFSPPVATRGSGGAELSSQEDMTEIRGFEKSSVTIPEVQAKEPKKLDYVPDELLVKTSQSFSTQDMEELQRSVDFKVLEEFDIPDVMKSKFDGRLFRIKLPQGMSVDEGKIQLSRGPGVFFAEPNSIVRLVEPVQSDDPAVSRSGSDVGDGANGQNKPNDLDSRLWGLHNEGQTGGTPDADIDAPEAWTITTGDKDGPVLAVIDTGIDYNHIELKNNMWKNPGEVPGDGVDNDGNGFIDDIYGYNFGDSNSNPADDNSHGTHCAGTIGAEGNNGQGVVGVNWQARIMAIRFLSASGSGTLADAIKAHMYAAQMGARVTSNSWGGGGFNQALYDVLKASPALHIFAAGNESNDNDSSPAYPASFDLPNIVSVAASTDKDQFASFSNWGRTTVDLAAPGNNIYSTIPGNKYGSKSGTSMAAPHVAGATKLILSKYPNATNEQLKDRLINTVDRVPAFAGKTVSGGRLNLRNALEEDTVPPAAPAEFKSPSSGALYVDLAWTAPGDDGMEGTASRYELRYADRPIVEGPAGEGQISWSDARSADAPQPGPSGTAQTARVSLPPNDSAKTYYFALKATDNLGNQSPLVTASADTKPAAIAFKDDSEGDDSLWNLQKPWGKDAVSGRGQVRSDSPGGPYDNNVTAAMTSVPIDLSKVSNPVLIFSETHDLEKGYDYGYVEVSSDKGASWNTLATYDGNQGWHQEAIPLDAYSDKDVQLRFRVKTDNSVVREGWQVDDIVVAGEPK